MVCLCFAADFILYKVVRKNRRVDLHVVHNIGTLDTQTRPKFVCYQNTRPFFCNPEISNLGEFTKLLYSYANNLINFLLYYLCMLLL